MRAEAEKERIEKAQEVLERLSDGRVYGLLELWQGGPVAEWQVRFVKRLQRESMINAQSHGFQMPSRMGQIVRAASKSVPAVVELLWPERTKDVLRNLQRLPQEPMAAAPVASPAPAPAKVDYVDTMPKLAPVSTEAVVLALRQHGPTPKRELQDKLGGKRQTAAESIEQALRASACFFGHIPGHARARLYLKEHMDAAQAAIEAAAPEPIEDVVADATPDETDAPEADYVDDDTFKATVLKYTVIYGQNFITIGEHFRVMHESIARLEAKIEALTERLEKKA